MNNQEARNWVLNNCFTNDGNKLNRWKEKETIIKLKDFFGRSFGEKCYCVLNNITFVPKCECGSEKLFKSFQEGYGLFCSRSCASTSIFVREKISKLKNDVYSDESKKIEFVSKIKKTKLQKYGSENYRNSEKIKLTCLEKYSCDNPRKNKTVIEKIIQTKRNNSPFDDGFILTHLDYDSIVCLKNKKWMLDSLEIYEPEEIADVLKCSYQTVYNFGVSHGFTFSKRKSGIENEVVNFVKEIYNGEIIVNSFKIIPPKQLDIYLPEKGLAIEIDGLYYHSYDRKETKEEMYYHKNKTDECAKLGIQLLHIYDSEWVNDKEKIKSFIKNKIGLNNIKVGARKCTIEKINDNKVIENFYEKNHIQGYSKACALNYGLIYDGKIISLMSFSKSRFNKNADFELIRFANLLDYKVQGAASRLLKAFRKEYEGCIVSYSDNRYSSGELYGTLNFELIGNVAIRYNYMRGNKLYNRMNFQKKKLPNILENFNPDLTEGQNMFNNGYRRIWDCGKKVWLLY